MASTQKSKLPNELVSATTNQPKPPDIAEGGGGVLGEPPISASEEAVEKPSVSPAPVVQQEQGLPSKAALKAVALKTPSEYSAGGFSADSSVDEEEEEKLPTSALTNAPPHDWSDQVEEERQLEAKLLALEEGAEAGSLSDLLTEIATWTEFSERGEYSVASVEHNFITKNREVESALGTDVFAVDSSLYSLRLPAHEKHTRNFEALGHYAPNLVVVRDGRPVNLAPRKWIKLSGSATAFRFSETRRTPPSGWVRYRLLNGKYVEFRSRRVCPAFAVIPPLPECLEMPAMAIRQDLTEEEIQSTVATELLTPGELFDAAVDRAGSPEAVKLLPYSVPSPQAMPDSQHYPEWLRLRTQQEPTVRLPPAGSAKEALLECMKFLEGRLTSPDSRELLAELETIVNPKMTPEEASAVYTELLSHFSGQLTLEENDIVSTNLTVVPCHSGEAEDEFLVVDHCVGGQEHHLTATSLREGEYRLFGPAFLAPDGASSSAVTVLANFPALKGRVRAVPASFSAEFPWYALSITPKLQHEGRGTLSDGITWFEKMRANLDYRGPVFLGRPDDDDAKKWARIFNTTYFEEILLLGRVRVEPRLFLYMSKEFPDIVPSQIPGSARGIGVADGRLVLSPLLENRERWAQDARQDMRTLFPRDVIAAVINYPDRYRVKNPVAYADGYASLVLEVKLEGLGTRDVYYRSGMTFHPNANSLEGLLVEEDDTVSQSTVDGGVHLRLPVVPPRSKRVDETADSEWGIPDDPNAPGWKLKGPGIRKPHSECDTFSDSTVIRKIGNWDANWDTLKKTGLTEEKVKQLYSVHWQAANSPRKHSIVKYHHPLWTDSLKGTPVNRSRWFWPTNALAPHAYLSTNDAGQVPLFGQEALEYNRKKQRAAANASFFQGASIGRGRTSTRGRGLMARARGGGRGAVTAAQPLSSASAPAPTPNEPQADPSSDGAWW